MANKTPRKYDIDFKTQAIKLSKEIGCKRTAEELGIPVQTIYSWNKLVRKASSTSAKEHIHLLKGLRSTQR